MNAAVVYHNGQKYIYRFNEKPETAIFPMPKMDVVYMVGKRTSATQVAARHIADANGKPLCWSTKHTSSKSFGGGFVRDHDAPTCKHCIKLYDES